MTKNQSLNGTQYLAIHDTLSPEEAERIIAAWPNRPTAPMSATLRAAVIIYVLAALFSVALFIAAVVR